MVHKKKTDLEINFVPSAKQLKAWNFLADSITTEIGYGGAAFGGKSYLGCFWLMAMAETKPETAWLMGRKELINLKRTTYLTFMQVCKDYNVREGHRFTVDLQHNIIRWWNGSLIFMLDLGWQPSDPLYTRLGGLELTGAFIDESNEVPIEAINVLKTRLGRKKNKDYKLLPKLLETFNPDKTHVYSRYYKPWVSSTLPPHRQFIKALPQDNPACTKEYLEQLRNSDKITRERLLEGNFEYDDDPGRLMDFDAINDLFTNKLKPVEDRYITVDVARMGKDRSVIMYWVGWDVKEIKVLDKCSITQLEEAVRDVCDRYYVARSNVIADEDGVGGGFVDHFGCRGFVNNSSAIQPREAQWNKDLRNNFSNLRTQAYYYLGMKVGKREVAISVEEWREEVVEELGQVKRKNDTDGKIRLISKDEIKENIGRSPDFADALAMRSWFDLRPKKVGVSEEEYEKAARGFTRDVKKDIIKEELGVPYREYENAAEKFINSLR